MATIYQSRAEDERLLSIIDAKVKGDMTSAQIREMYGISNSALSGIMWRYRDAERPCACVKPENRDGGMPDRWWSK
jgi:hypothetical protein